MESDNKAFVRRWFAEVWNKGNLDALQEMLDENAIVHNLPVTNPDSKCGPAEFAPFVQTFRGALPDIQFTVEAVISEGNMAAARCSVRGTHTGDSLGIAASHKPVQITGMTMVRLENGKIVEGWNNFDIASLYEQIKSE
ncbi:MAG: ester cyclase [Abitibacteriaceae bacterium]|nr:ester cyclase [Abditibacteriaceae bacterium]MBV9867063.1 ester cyclase [Abditibacteriaceae bacterium]